MTTRIAVVQHGDVREARRLRGDLNLQLYLRLDGGAFPRVAAPRCNKPDVTIVPPTMRKRIRRDGRSLTCRIPPRHTASVE